MIDSKQLASWQASCKENGMPGLSYYEEYYYRDPDENWIGDDIEEEEEEDEDVFEG